MQAPVVMPEAESSPIANLPIADEHQARSEPAGPSRLRLYGLAMAGGVMLWLCHFPVAWGWLGWVALVPLLTLLRIETTGRRRYFSAWLMGTAYFWPAISWMTVADIRMVACWAMLSFYCSLYFPVCIALVRGLERGARLPLVITFPAVWTALEYLRSFFGTGFSWYLIGHTQHDALIVIQIADIGGAFAVGFLAATVNVIVFEVCIIVAPIRHWLRLAPARCISALGLVLQLGWVMLLLGGTVAYGQWRLDQAAHQVDLGPGLRIALLQGNVDQRLRIAADRSPEAQAKVHAAYQDLCIAASKLQPRPQLIVWPETSYPVPWSDVAPRVNLAAQSPEFHKLLDWKQDMVRVIGPISKTNVLLGLNTEEIDYDNKSKRFNSALLIDAKGKPVMRYDKLHRVPFGEYVPFRDWLPFMNVFAPYENDYSITSGEVLTRFPLDGFRFGVLVCYEDTDPFMAREYGRHTSDGPPVDFILNLSNDGWFDGSSEHEEHLAISRFRAIEARRPLARSVNMGISAVIDGSGRVLAPAKQKVGEHEIWTIGGNGALPVSSWREFKKTEGIVVFDLPVDNRQSIYALWGDWLPNGCWGLIGFGLLWGLARRTKALPQPAAS